MILVKNLNFFTFTFHGKIDQKETLAMVLIENELF